jgi:hypothetical protein
VSWYTAKKTAVHRIFAVCWFLPLSCCLLCRAFNRVFVVRRFFAVHFPDFTRQRNLCRAEAHGKERLHGNAYFSGSARPWLMLLLPFYVELVLP